MIYQKMISHHSFIFYAYIYIYILKFESAQPPPVNCRFVSADF